jgi:hypothetical protein
VRSPLQRLADCITWCTSTVCSKRQQHTGCSPLQRALFCLRRAPCVDVPLQVFEYIMQSLANYRQMHMRMQQLSAEGVLDGTGTEVGLVHLSIWPPRPCWVLLHEQQCGLAVE